MSLLSDTRRQITKAQAAPIKEMNIHKNDVGMDTDTSIGGLNV